MKLNSSRAKFLIVLWSIALIGVYVLFSGGRLMPNTKPSRDQSTESVGVADLTLDANVPATTQAATEPSKTILWGSKSGIVVEPEQLKPATVLPSSKSGAIVLPSPIESKQILPSSKSDVLVLPSQIQSVPPSEGKLTLTPSTSPSPVRAPATQP